MNEFVPYNSHTCQSKTFDLKHTWIYKRFGCKKNPHKSSPTTINRGKWHSWIVFLSRSPTPTDRKNLIDFFFVCCSIWRSLRWQCRQQHQQQWKLQQLVYYYNNKYNTNFFFIHDSIDFLRKTVLCSIPFRLIGFWFGRLFNFFFYFFFHIVPHHCHRQLNL